MKRKMKNLLPLGCLAVLMGGTGAQAAPVTISGNFSDDTTINFTSETFTSSTLLTAFTTSYAGGKNLNGTTTAAGGFLPVLTLWSSSGAIDSTNGTGDAFLSDTVMPGTYEITLTEFPNSANPAATNWNAPDAFGPFGDSTLSSATFTGDNCGTPGKSFVDCTTGNQLTSAFTLNIDSSAASAVPEPASIALTAGALVAVGFLRRRKNIAK